MAMKGIVGIKLSSNLNDENYKNDYLFWYQFILNCGLKSNDNGKDKFLKALKNTSDKKSLSCCTSGILTQQSWVYGNMVY